MLQLAGPLPQYHPAVLGALVLAGRLDAALAVLCALLGWLRALRQQQEAAGTAGVEAARLQGGPFAAQAPQGPPKYQGKSSMSAQGDAVQQ